ncbi:hypothetical protein V5799_013769 [Amblyomma americanum]|uniref:Uncharacterized protein n=2 Tax=Amblyomma americanum TaxID=6943 RepID=A0AAQ4E4Y7_AMBAM
MAVKEVRETQSKWDSPLPKGEGKRPPIILQQSVTMLAYMDKDNRSVAQGTDKKLEGSFLDSFVPGHSRDLPILIGAAMGAVGLIVIILTVVVVWHCCTRKTNNDKAYVVENLSRSSSITRPPAASMVQSDSVIFLSAKSRHPTGTRLNGNAPDGASSVESMSQLHFGQHSFMGDVGGTRPLSECGVHTVDVPYAQPSSAASLDGEVTLQVPSLSHCSSYSHRGLEDSYCSIYGSSDLTLKTRSLPSWGRAKQRPLSTEDDLSELYAKVNFSKRRKNRMRNDSAAAIAATRSFQHQQCYLSPFHTLPSAHTDTDSLVDNEAVVVYDERTAV